MRNGRIIAFAPNDWDGMWMNRQQLLSRLATSWPILYSTGVGSTWDRRPLRGSGGGLLGRFAMRGHVTVDQPPALVMRVPGVSLLDRLAVGVAASRWRSKLNSLGTGPIVAYTFHSGFRPYVEALRPDYIVYHAYDLYWRAGGSDAAADSDQSRLLSKAHLIIASSRVIADELAARSGRRVHTLPNAVDFEAFAGQGDTVEPADIARIPRPRVGHVGRLNRKVDIELILALAARHPEWSFVLVGPRVDLAPEEAALYERARHVTNIHLLGAKERDELPRYMHALDVGMLAYRQGLWVEGIYPLKLHEYLACGLPIVSSDIPSVREFPHVVRTATTIEEWGASIAAALAEDGPQQRELRQSTARANSWDERVEVLRELLEGMLGQERSARPSAHSLA